MLEIFPLDTKVKVDKEYITFDIFSNKQLEKISKYDFKKIKVNNKLRSVIKASLAQINLMSPKKDKRLKSAKNLLKHLSIDDKNIVKQALSTEKDSDVKEILEEIISNLDAKFETGDTQIQAIKNLGDYLSSKTMQTLTEIISENKSELIVATAKEAQDRDTSHDDDDME